IIMNKQIIEVIEELREKQEMIDNLNQTHQEETKKLNDLKAKQENEFDFEREEQISNKQNALNKLNEKITSMTNEFEDLYKGHSIKLNNRIRRDKDKLIKRDENVQHQVDKVVKLKQDYENSKLELQEELEKVSTSYDDKLFELGNDVVGFKIEKYKIDDFMANL